MAALTGISPSEILGLLGVALALAISAPAGVGGGGIVLPIYMLVFKFTTTQAVSLTSVTVLGGALANACYLIPKRHPSCNSPLIDWNAVLLFEPAIIGGVVIGTFVNKILPGWALILGLAFTLSYVSYRTVSKGIALFVKESTKPLANFVKVPTTAPIDGVLVSSSSAERVQALAINDPLGEAYQAPIHAISRNITSLTLLSLSIAMLEILKGGKGFPSPIGIPCGSALFWFVTSFIFVIVVGFTVLSRKKILSEVQTPFQEREMNSVGWNPTNTVHYPCFCVSAGLLAGLFGLGGGMITTPLMLELGFLPTVASACSSIMILFTSITACISFVVFGQLQPHSAIMFVFIGFIPSLTGQLLANFTINRLKRTSIIVLSMGFIIALSTIGVIIQTTHSLRNSTTQHGSLCS